MSEPAYVIKIDASAGNVWTDTSRTAPATAQGAVVQGLTDQSGNGYHATYDGSSTGGPALKLDTDTGVPALDFAAGKTLSFGNPSALNTLMAGKGFTAWLVVKTGPTLVNGDYPIFVTKAAPGEGRLSLLIENCKFNNYTHFVGTQTITANTLYVFRFSLTDVSSVTAATGYELLAEGGAFPQTRVNTALTAWDTTHALRMGTLSGFVGNVDWLLFDLRLCLGVPTQEQIDTVERLLAVKYRARSDLNLIGVGNSIIAGYGLGSPSTQSLLAVAGAAAGLPKSNILNLGDSGTYAYQWRYGVLAGLGSGAVPSPAISDVRTAIRPSITRNLVVITVADNDLWGGVSAEETYDSTLGLVRYCQSLGCEVVVTTALPRYSDAREAVRTVLNGYIRAGASIYRYVVADFAANPQIGPVHANEDGSGGYTASTYYQDGTHPNALGASIAGAIVAVAIAASIPMTIPSPADVRLRTPVNGAAGSLAVPAFRDVRAGVAVDAGTGTLDLPSPVNVRLGTAYDGNTQTGQLPTGISVVINP